MLSGQYDQRSCILIDTSVTPELMNQVLSFTESKRSFNREHSRKKIGLACSLEYCLVIIVNNWSSLSSVKGIEKKDIPAQNPFDTNFKTKIAFHHIMKLEKGIAD